MPDVHAKFSPSAMHRVMACPGSLALEETQPDSKGEAAELGTKAHENAAALIKARIAETPIENLPHDLPEDMTEIVDFYVDYAMDVIEPIQAVSGAGWVERWVDIFKNPDGSNEPFFAGTADLIVVEPLGVLHVMDLKTGHNPVDPVNNPQCAAYVLGALNEPTIQAESPTSIRVHIVQPAVTKDVKTWDIDDIDAFVDEWSAKFSDAIHAALEPDAPRYVTAACQYCRAKLVCPEMTAAVQAAAVADFSDGSLDLVWFHERAKVIKKFLSEVEERLTSMALEGGQVAGYKLVEAIGNREWGISDAELSKKLRNQGLKKSDYIVEKVISPAQLEKAKVLEPKAIEKMLDKYCVRKSRGLTLVPESDRRPAAKVSAQADFNEE